MGEFVLKQCQDDVFEGAAKVHKQDPGFSSRRVQVLEDEVKSEVDRVVYRWLNGTVLQSRRERQSRGQVLCKFAFTTFDPY